jgi:hypothetical protein
MSQSDFTKVQRGKNGPIHSVPDCAICQCNRYGVGACSYRGLNLVTKLEPGDCYTAGTLKAATTKSAAFMPMIVQFLRESSFLIPFVDRYRF